MISIQEAMDAVDQFDIMTFFDRVTPNGRVLIAQELMAMVNWPPERIIKNGHGQIVPYVEPSARLAILMQALKHVSEWPGMAQIRAIYCMRFRPADGIVSECWPTVPGFTEEDGPNNPIALAATPEPMYLPQPGDIPSGDLIGQVPALAEMKRLR